MNVFWNPVCRKQDLFFSCLFSTQKKKEEDEEIEVEGGRELIAPARSADLRVPGCCGGRGSRPSLFLLFSSSPSSPSPFCSFPGIYIHYIWYP